MQPVFTLQYAEYMVAEKLNDIFKKYSVFIPLSSQEKGIDMMLYNREAAGNKSVTIQVKSSRVYFGEKSSDFKNYLWMNRFEPQKNADLFMLTGIYPKYPDEIHKTNCNSVKWNKIILVFTYEEIVDFLSNIRLKRNPEKLDNMFAFGFDDPNVIYLTRGNLKNEDYSNFLIENRIDTIKNMFN